MDVQNNKRIVLGSTFFVCCLVFLTVLYIFKPAISLMELMTLPIRANIHFHQPPVLDFDNSNFLYNAVVSTLPDVQLFGYPFLMNLLICLTICLAIVLLVFLVPDLFSSFCFGMLIIMGYCITSIYLSHSISLWIPVIWPFLVQMFVLMSAITIKIQAKQNRLVSTIQIFGYDINLFPNSISFIRNVVKQPKKTEITLAYFKIKIPQTFVDDNLAIDVASMVNIPFEIITDTILKNGGLIDKTSSSSVVAYWFGKDNSYLATKCAMEIDRILKEEFYADKKNLIIKVSCGINTDTGVFAMLGTKKFSNYTVIGNSVDIATRLENACIFHNASILISQKTFDNIKDRIIASHTGLLSVHGKQSQIDFFEPTSFIENKMSYFDKRGK